jgi:hypothetical protein
MYKVGVSNENPLKQNSKYLEFEQYQNIKKKSHNLLFAMLSKFLQPDVF